MNRHDRFVINLVKIIFGVIAIVTVSYFILGTGSANIRKKDILSDFNGGLERTATVYTNDGKHLKTWNGKIDIHPNTNNCINMIVDGERRIIIYGGILIVEEK